MGCGGLAVPFSHSLGGKRRLVVIAATDRTLANVIDGAAITFVDNARQKQTEAALRGAHAFAENMVSTVREPLLVLDEHLQGVSADRASCSTFQVKRDETLGRMLHEPGNGQIATMVLFSRVRLRCPRFLRLIGARPKARHTATRRAS